MTSCRICAHPTTHFAQATVRGRYEAEFCRCDNCGFVQILNPHWLDEAYSSAITSSDVGLVSRNLFFAGVTQAVISFFFDRDSAFVDYGGGYGLMVRLMRDAGYDFYWYDKYCTNLFAQSYEANRRPGGTFALVTACEVFEHWADPAEGIEELLGFSSSILFTTLLLPKPAPPPDAWWYYGLEHGQHLAFYTIRSLELLGQKHGLRFYSNGINVHLLTSRTIHPLLFKLVTKRKVANLVKQFNWRQSLVDKDYQEVVERSISHG